MIFLSGNNRYLTPVEYHNIWGDLQHYFVAGEMQHYLLEMEG
jgi:hypothetical protein